VLHGASYKIYKDSTIRQSNRSRVHISVLQARTGEDKGLLQSLTTHVDQSVISAPVNQLVQQFRDIF